MRNQRGEFTAGMSAEELTWYRRGIAGDRLKRVLTAEFAADGGVRGVTADEMRWAMQVVKTRPDWAIPVLRALGFGDCVG